MMATTPESYAGVRHLATRPPSWILAALPEDAELPPIARIMDRIEASSRGLRFETVIGETTLEEARWELELTAERDQGEPMTFRVWVQQMDDLGEMHLELEALPPDEIEATRRSRWAIGVGCSLGDNALADFHRQLQVLCVVAPEAVMILDIPACRAHSPRWLATAATTPVPPNPAYLFTIHAVRDESRPDGPLWLHTHGLLRCGSIELELFDVDPDNVQILVELLGASARLFIESEPPTPGTAFAVGPGIELMWLPWEQMVRRPPRYAFIEQLDRDHAHSLPSGVLLVPPRPRLLGLLPGRPGNPALYVPSLVRSPVLFVSNQESARMTELARERLASFAAIYRRFGACEGWSFLVKLAYDIDGATSADECEHLWFEVHDIGDEQVEATLANQPQRIDRLHEGDRDTHPLSRLKDWVILSPHGRFDPDTVAHLERLLQAGGEG
jgi:hypothetical protein